MTQRIVLLMICAAILCAPHGKALARQGRTAALQPLKPRPAIVVGPNIQFEVNLRFWNGDSVVSESSLDVIEGHIASIMVGEEPGGRMRALVFIVTPAGVLTRQDLEAYLDKDSARMYDSSATAFCVGGVWFYVYALDMDRCEVRITRRESWITRRPEFKLVDRHSIGSLCTRIFEPGVTLHMSQHAKDLERRSQGLIIRPGEQKGG